MPIALPPLPLHPTGCNGDFQRAGRLPLNPALDVLARSFFRVGYRDTRVGNSVRGAQREFSGLRRTLIFHLSRNRNNRSGYGESCRNIGIAAGRCFRITLPGYANFPLPPPGPDGVMPANENLRASAGVIAH